MLKRKVKPINIDLALLSTALAQALRALQLCAAESNDATQHRCMPEVLDLLRTECCHAVNGLKKWSIVPLRRTDYARADVSLEQGHLLRFALKTVA